MDTTAVDYRLPAASIAQVPIEPRDAARLLIDVGRVGCPIHGRVVDLPRLVGPGDVVVLNDTKVIPARLRCRRPSGGQAEVLLLEPHAPDGETVWEALVRPSRKLPPGALLEVGPSFQVALGAELGEGHRLVELHLPPGAGVLDMLDRYGEVPLPPYITEPLADAGRYQTTYAARAGSVAAPTAGLHLTPEVLTAVRGAGARVVAVELRIGLGTFRPITADLVEDHRMHAEAYRVPADTLEACRSGRRVVAVGTTTVRALETAAASGRLEGRTDLFIHGGRPFAVVDALLTNFHQPRSSLLVLVEAFVGPRWRGLYDEALRAGYRFLSFGDAMFLRGERG